MSLADLEADLPPLTPAQRAHLEKAMQYTEPFRDAELIARLERILDAADRGEGIISKEEMIRRLRAAGREV